MGRHNDPDTLAFIDWIAKYGSSKGYETILEYPLLKNKFIADVVWKLKDFLISFEIDTKDTSSIFSNAAKYFLTSSKQVTKPWRHFMIVYKDKLSQGHRDSLFILLNLHNILLFESLFYSTTERERFEKELRNIIDASELVKQFTVNKPLGESLYLVAKAFEEGLKSDILRSNSEVEITIKNENVSTKLSNKGIEFTVKTFTPKGEPTFLDKIRETNLTGKPFTIKTPELVDFSEQGKSILTKDTKEIKLTVTPQSAIIPMNISVPDKDLIFKDILFRIVKSVGSKDYFSSEDRNLPCIFGFIVDKREKKASFRYKLNSKVDAVQALKLEEFLRHAEAQGKVLFTNLNTGRTIATQVHVKASNDKDSWYDVISKLALIQEKTEHRIFVPSNISEEDIGIISSITRVLSSGQDKVPLKEFSIKIDKKGAETIVSFVRKEGKIPYLGLTESEHQVKLFGEDISLGPCKWEFHELEFTRPLEEVEELVENSPEDGFVNLDFRLLEEGIAIVNFEKCKPVSDSEVST